MAGKNLMEVIYMKGQKIKEIILKHFLLSLMIIVLLCNHCTILAVNLTSYALENEADARNVVFEAYVFFTSFILLMKEDLTYNLL